MKDNEKREAWEPRRLPIVRIGATYYFLDLRLRQLRDVTNPHNYIDF